MLMAAVENRAGITAKEEVAMQFGKAVEQQVLLTYQQPCFNAYSVSRGVFNDTRVCFHRRVYTDVNQAKVLVEGHWKDKWECHRSTVSQAVAEATAH